jgi:hypothetical protein
MKEEIMKKLESKLAKIDATFKPSTTTDDNKLFYTDYPTYSAIVIPKQRADWDRIKRFAKLVREVFDE